MSRRNGRNAKSPAFQVYPGDFIHNVETAGMTAEEIGAYWLLICYSWDGPLPNDERRLARMARLTPARFARAWVAVSRCFQLDERNTLTNPRVERERLFQKQNRDRMRDLSQKAAQARQEGTSRSPYGAPCGVPPESPVPIPDTRIPKPGEEEKPARADKPRRGRGKPTVEAVAREELPERLRSDEMVAVLAEFLEFRRTEKGDPVTPIGLRNLLLKLEPHGAAHAAATLRDSMANGWKGVFPERRASGAPSALQPKPGGMREWFAEQDRLATDQGRTVDVEGGVL